MLRLRYVALLTAIGCSPVKDASNVPDASIDAMDTRPAMIASSVPADKATKVSILQPISVFFDEPLDPASVSDATVKVGYDNAANYPLVLPGHQIVPPYGAVSAALVPVKGTVTYNADARKISFVPAAPLPYGATLTVSVDVKDTAGIASTGRFTFTTFINLNTKQFFFNTSTGLPTSWVATPADMTGRLSKRVGSSGAGTDTVWFTPDDPRNQHYQWKYTPEGRLFEERQYNPGTDGLYDTADDVVVYCIAYTYTAEGYVARRNYSSNAGADTMFCTFDDVPTYDAVYEYADGALKGYILNSTPGPDNIWRNADDRCIVWYDFVYDAEQNKNREIYRGCGSDQLPRTSDDTFSHYYEYEYDANRQQTKMTYRNGAGTDGIWLTADDNIGQMERYVRTPEGLVTELFRSFAPGPDNIWGTPDDTSGNRTSTTYNADKLAEEITLYSGPGADAMWGTTDDVISNYQKLTYNELGNRTDLKFYAAGPDGLWRTADDRVSQDWEFDLKE